MSFWTPRPRQPFIGLAIAAVLGVWAADRWETPPVLAFGLTALGVMAVLFRPSPMTCWLLCGLVFFELHTVRHYGSDAGLLAQVLAPAPRVIRATGIVWSEPDIPATTTGRSTTKARFVLKAETLTIDRAPVPADLLINVAWAGEMPAYGDRVSLLGSAANLEEARNPGQFDFVGYQRRRGVHSEIHTRYAADCRVESHGHGQRVQVFAFATSHWIQRQLKVDLEHYPEISDLITSMVLGMRGDTPEDMKALFQRTGTMHLFAVSGLNVAMLAAIVLAILRPFAIRRGAAVFVIIPILIVYALVTGLAASCVRATIMVSLVLFGHVVDRRPLALNGLGAAAFFILLWDTEQFFLLGFQFSFVLVVAIVALANRIQRRIEQTGQPDAFLPRDLWNVPQRARVFCVGQLAVALSVTLSAWIGSLLFTVTNFHLFSLSTIFANLIAVPLAFVILVLALASIISAPVWTTGVILCNNANFFCAGVLLKVLELFALLPGSYVYVETPRLPRAPACEFTVFDLGDGGATFLRADRCDWMLDCGAANDYDRILLPYLRSRGVNRLDGLLFTHGSSRHIGGAFEAVNDFHPYFLADSVLKDGSTTRRRLQELLNQRGDPKGLYERGDIIHVGPRTTIRVLYPPAGLKRNLAEDKALVLQLDAGGGRRALFMSSSGFTTERWLIENEPDLRSDLLIKGQHTKDLSGTPDFLARVQPQAVICGQLGFGKSPSALDPWVKDLTARGITVFRQDRTGAVQVELRGDAFTVRGYLNNQTFRTHPR